LTEKRLNQLKLALETQKFETIFRISPVSLALWRGEDFIFEKVNPQYQEIFGNRQLIGKPFLEAVPELKDQGFIEKLKNVYETGVPFVGEEVLARIKKTEDGTLEDHYYNFTFYQITDEDGKPYGVFDHALDVTDAVYARRQLQNAIGELEVERDLREKFVAALTHDLRTPLTAAKMSAQLLERKIDTPYHILTNRIVTNMDRADEMIRDLLDASKIKAGEKVPLDIKECNLNEIIKSTVEDLITVHGDRFIYSSSPMIVGFWDENAIRRILENLANNAVKYGFATTQIFISSKLNNDSVELSVMNQGIPMSEKEQITLFEPYKRSHSALYGQQKGWGLGLTLVKGLVEALGGNIKVNSDQKSGTTFSFTLPLDSRTISPEVNVPFH
jgi:PAS domain S-box-containing protein